MTAPANNNSDQCLVHSEVEESTWVDSNRNAQWTKMTMHNANNNNIMATITIWNIIIHNDSMNHALNGLQ